MEKQIMPSMKSMENKENRQLNQERKREKTMRKKLLLSIVLMSFCLSFAGCSFSRQRKDTPAEATTEDYSASTNAELLELLEKVKDFEYHKKSSMDKVFANARLYDFNDKGNQRVAYVFLNVAKYHKEEGKATMTDGKFGQAVITFENREEGIHLKNIDWGEEGEFRGEWLRQNFPEYILDKMKTYKINDFQGNNKLLVTLNKEAEKEMGVPVEESYPIQPIHNYCGF